MKFGLDEKVIEDIVNILRKYEEVESARIFGSRARGDYRKASDIDIALFGKHLTSSINTKIFFDIDDLYSSKDKTCQTLLCMPVIPALERSEQDDHDEVLQCIASLD